MSFQIFPGQGVYNIEVGYFGVVHEVAYKERQALVIFYFKGKMYHDLASFDRLGPAEMSPEELELRQGLLKAMGNTDGRGSRTLVLVDDIDDQKTINALNSEENVGHRKELLHPIFSFDGMSTGGKCSHGVYIPPQDHGDDAYSCSICHPFVIFSKKKGVEFKA